MFTQQLCNIKKGHSANGLDSLNTVRGVAGVGLDAQVGVGLPDEQVRFKDRTIKMLSLGFRLNPYLKTVSG